MMQTNGKRLARMTAVLMALFCPGVVPAQETKAERLEQALVRRAPGLVREFQMRGYSNVGVLKFLVSKDGKAPSDSVGQLNMLLARRLELALILGNDPRKPIGIIGNASAVAARTTGANHLSTMGRQRLFEPDYPLAWGKETVKADAFVTGLVSVKSDLQQMTIGLLVCDRKEGKLREIGEDFVVRNDPGKLGEMSESFVLRRVKDDSGDERPRREQQVLKATVAARQEGRNHPLADKGEVPPVRLEIRYNGKPMPLTFRDGQAHVEEPRENQKVTLVLRRDGTKQRYGVVVKVNGESTIDRQKEPDLHCRRWILEPGSGPLEIKGFQMSDTKMEEFKVLSRAESKTLEMNYGEEVGTVTFTVFREQLEDEVEVILGAEARNTEAVAKARPSKNAHEAMNWSALKAQLLNESNRGTTLGGLMVPGAETTNKVTRVRFRPDPTPVMTATVVYYRR